MKFTTKLKNLDWHRIVCLAWIGAMGIWTIFGVRILGQNTKPGLTPPVAKTAVAPQANIPASWQYQSQEIVKFCKENPHEIYTKLGPNHEYHPVPCSKILEASISGTSTSALTNIPLTAEETKDLEINELQSENLAMRIQQLTEQVSQARAKQADATKALNDYLVAAHRVDMTKYRLDPKAKAFVPLQK